MNLIAHASFIQTCFQNLRSRKKILLGSQKFRDFLAILENFWKFIAQFRLVASKQFWILKLKSKKFYSS